MDTLYNVVNDQRRIVSVIKESCISHSSHQKSEILGFLQKYYPLFSIILLLFMGSCERDDARVDNNFYVKDVRSPMEIGYNIPMSQSYNEWYDMGVLGTGGIRLYKKNRNNGIWYVIKVYLPEVKITPIAVNHIASTSSNPIFEKRNITNWQSHWITSNALALLNASFFNMSYDPTGPFSPLGDQAIVSHAFGLNNILRTLGSENDTPGRTTLIINNHRARITTAPMSALWRYEALVSGLDIDSVLKDPNNITGRTVAGIDTDGTNIVYFFVSSSAKQQEAKQALQDFGCSKFVMFDGSNSSQMAWGNNILVNETDYFIPRRIPVLLRFDNR